MFVYKYPILNFVSTLPRELRKELVEYSFNYAFVLDKTGLFPVTDSQSYHSRYWLSWNAAIDGYLELLKWTHYTGCPRFESMCNRAAEAGHLHVIKWLFQIGCTRTESICSFAAFGGHLSLLKWLR